MSVDTGPPNGATLMDAGAITVLFGVLTNVLPTIASLLTVLWMIIRILETETVTCYRKSRRLKKRLKAKHKGRGKRPTPLGDDSADPNVD